MMVYMFKVTFVEEMGNLSGVNVALPPPVDNKTVTGMLQMTATDPSGMGGAGRQLVPGLLLMSDGTTALPYPQPS